MKENSHSVWIGIPIYLAFQVYCKNLHVLTFFTCMLVHVGICTYILYEKNNHIQSGHKCII